MKNTMDKKIKTLEKEQSNRVRLAGGPFVTPLTLSTIKTWSSSNGLSLGEVLDQLTDHANKTGISFVK